MLADSEPSRDSGRVQVRRSKHLDKFSIASSVGVAVGVAAIDPACRSTSRHTRPPISISLYNHTIDLSKARPEGWHRLRRLIAEKQHAEKEPKDVHALHVIFPPDDPAPG